jgi:hypothetical protein
MTIAVIQVRLKTLFDFLPFPHASFSAPSFRLRFVTYKAPPPPSFISLAPLQAELDSHESISMQHLKDRHAAEARAARAEAQLAAALETVERQRARHDAAAAAWSKEKATLAAQLEAARLEHRNGAYGLQRDLRQARDALAGERGRSNKLVKQMKKNTAMLQRLEQIESTLHHEDQRAATTATSTKQQQQQQQQRRPHTSAGTVSQRVTSGGGGGEGDGEGDVAFIDVAAGEGGVDTAATNAAAGGDGNGDGDDLFDVEYTLTAAPAPERHHTTRDGPGGVNPRRTSSAGAARSQGGAVSMGANGAAPHYSGYSDRVAQRSVTLGAGRPAAAAAAAAHGGSAGGASRHGHGHGRPASGVGVGGGGSPSPVDAITAQVQAAIAAAADQVARAGETDAASPGMMTMNGYEGGGGGGGSPTQGRPRGGGRASMPAETAEDVEVMMRRVGVGDHRPRTAPTHTVPTSFVGQRKRLIFGGGFTVHRKSVMDLREKEAGRGAFRAPTYTGAHNPETYQDTGQQRSVSSHGHGF